MKNIQKFIDGLHDYLARAFAPVNERFATIERRLSAIEKSVSDFQYRGVWTDGDVYSRNNAVTSGGDLWICKVPRTVEKPGGNTDWQLAVRKGRDGRDMRP